MPGRKSNTNAALRVIEQIAGHQAARTEWTVTFEAELGSVSMSAQSCVATLRIPFEHRGEAFQLTDSYGDLVNVTISTKGAEVGP